jgi:colanic acid biosynthesis glycosyl transferase WcaI
METRAMSERTSRDRGATTYLVHDFAGHPFQAELSRELATRGHSVVHAYCGGVTTGQGDLKRRPQDAAGLSFIDLASRPFERYSPIRRVIGELDYGTRLARMVMSRRPAIVLSANTPLVSQLLLWGACQAVRARKVYWVQDFLGRGVRSILQQRNAIIGAVIGRAFEVLETALLRWSDAIVVISGDFITELRDRRVQVPAEVIENWAPLGEVGHRERPEVLANDRGTVVLYSGTLGLKHDPIHLIEVARLFAGTRFRLVVVTEGLGRDALEKARREEGLERLLLLDYVPYEELEALLDSADVCLALLDPAAGAFSVPSKVLTYLAAGKPIVAAIPSENLASRTILDAGAGMVVTPGDYSSFADAVVAILADEGLREEMGNAARGYAELHFDVQLIADRIEAVVKTASASV